MGAGHSKSQTVNIPNPKPMEVQTINVSPTVMARLENAKHEQEGKHLEKKQEKNSNQDQCKCCKVEQEPSFNSNVEPEDYEEMMDRMDHILVNKPSCSYKRMQAKTAQMKEQKHKQMMDLKYQMMDQKLKHKRTNQYQKETKTVLLEKNETEEMEETQWTETENRHATTTMKKHRRTKVVTIINPKTLSETRMSKVRQTCSQISQEIVVKEKKQQERNVNHQRNPNLNHQNQQEFASQLPKQKTLQQVQQLHQHLKAQKRLSQKISSENVPKAIKITNLQVQQNQLSKNQNVLEVDREMIAQYNCPILNDDRNVHSNQPILDGNLETSSELQTEAEEEEEEDDEEEKEEEAPLYLSATLLILMFLILFLNGFFVKL